MQLARWQKIEEIFYRAVALPENERLSFVAETCGGDEELCREINALLHEDAVNEDFLNEPVYSAGLLLFDDDYTKLLETADFARYKLIKLLGRGGMGAVFLAEDTTLERRVALKILPPSVAEQQAAAARFRQEAKAASAISHPNVAHIYEFGEADGKYFLAMEYVAGKTLRELLKENAVNQVQKLDIIAQIADALSATHKCGIIHRDIKPENIIITETGLVKILDFGLAKLNAPTAEQLDGKILASLETTPGFIIGTTTYMSPEQVRGLPLDGRTDLWSLGVVMFEMLSGTRPFTGQTPSDIQAAILLKDPPLLELPTNLAVITGKLLRKNTAERYQTAADFLSNLHSVKKEIGEKERSFDTTPEIVLTKPDLSESTFLARGKFSKIVLPAILFLSAVFSAIYFSDDISHIFRHETTQNQIQPQKLTSLVVLPFRNETENEEIAFLSEGLAEDLTRNLGSLNQFEVISYASARKIKPNDNFEEIKNRLHVAALLRGRIKWENEKLLVSVELVDLADGKAIWTDKSSAAATDLLKIRNALAAVISDKFQADNGQEKQLVLTDYGTRSNEAFRAYLEGKYGSNRENTRLVKEAVKSLERAVALDPQYALAQAALADNYNLLGTWFGEKPNYYQPLAEKTLEKAIAVDSNLAEAHTTLAKIQMDFHHDWTAAEREFKKAIELNPNYALAHHWYGEVFLSAMGRYAESLRELETARRLNPFSSGIVTALAWTYIGKKDYEKAVELCDESLLLDPSNDSAYSYKSMALMKLGRFEEAAAAAKKSSSAEDSSELGVIYALSGHKTEARLIMERMKKRPDAAPYDFAVIYGALGEKDRAFELLEKQLKTNSVDLLSIRLDPLLDSLRDDQRFVDIQTKIHLP